MAQTTSQLWKDLFRMHGTIREYKFLINGVEYGPEAEVEHTYDCELFSEFGIGNATCAALTLRLYSGEVPRSATIQRFVRLRNDDQVSEWIPKGTFYTNHRQHYENYWEVEAYDAMRKGDQVWEPDQELEFPMPMTAAAAEFARILQVPLDPRNVLDSSYTIDYPANDYTVRDELKFIAAAHGGNWIITDENKLRLIPLEVEYPSIDYLVNENGENITFGGTAITV